MWHYSWYLWIDRESRLIQSSASHQSVGNLRKVICNALMFIKNLSGKNNLKTLLLARSEGSGWQIAEKIPRHEDIRIDETHPLCPP